jgi:hypothetical protein
MSWHHGDWLTLIQAIAAVAAIGGAFGVVFVQRHIDVAKQAEAERRAIYKSRAALHDVVYVARLVVEHLYVTLEEARNIVGSQSFLTANSEELVERINEHVAQIRQIPLYGLPTHVATALLAIDLACTNIRRTVADRGRGIANNGYGSYIHAIDEQMALIKNRTLELVIDWSD